MAIAALSLVIAALLVYQYVSQRSWDNERHALINTALHPETPMPIAQTVAPDEEQRTRQMDDIGLTGAILTDSPNGDEE